MEGECQRMITAANLREGPWQVHGPNGFEEWLLSCTSVTPLRAEYLPAAEHLRWHWKEAFWGALRE